MTDMERVTLHFQKEGRQAAPLADTESPFYRSLFGTSPQRPWVQTGFAFSGQSCEMDSTAEGKTLSFCLETDATQATGRPPQSTN